MISYFFTKILAMTISSLPMKPSEPELSFSMILRCEDPWYSLLESGEKPVEGRKGKEKYRSLKAGDTIFFQCVDGPRSFLAHVEKVDHFDSIISYLEGVGLKNALPGVDSTEEGEKIYSQWSTPEEIQEYGFVGIWISREGDG